MLKKNCQNCGVEFSRTKYKVSSALWEKRKFCSLKCGYLSREKSAILDMRAYKRAWDAKNKQKNIAYQEKHKPKRLIKAKEWRQKNRKKPKFRMASNLRCRLYMALRDQKTDKITKTFEYVGCTKDDLKKHLESLFQKGMSWDNYGKWHIDHKIPISSFDLTLEQEIYKAMNYQNLQPLWALDNIKKSNKSTT